MKMKFIFVMLWLIAGAHSGVLLLANPALSQTGASTDWERTVAAAKKEGKVVAGIPASADLRKQLETAFKAKFPAIEIELSPSRGPQNVRKIAEEYKAGIHNFDLSIGGTDTMLYGFVEPGIAEPFEPYMLLPEVKDPKQWWGGHIWGDNQSGKRFIYSFEAFTSDNLWHNTELVKAEGDPFLRRPAAAQVERQNRHTRSSQPGSRPLDLDVFMDDQGRGLSQETGAAGSPDQH